MGDDADGHELFTVVATVHHEGVGETFDDGALGLSESLDGISASGVRDIDGCSDLNIITVQNHISQKILLVPPDLIARLSNARKGIVRQRNIPNLNILVAPLIEQLDGANLVGDVLGENGIAAWALNLDFFRVFGHCEL